MGKGQEEQEELVTPGDTWPQQWGGYSCTCKRLSRGSMGPPLRVGWQVCSVLSGVGCISL